MARSPPPVVPVSSRIPESSGSNSPEHTLTLSDIRRNIENYADFNPTLEQLIAVHGPFVEQFNPSTTSLNERRNVIRNISKSGYKLYNKAICWRHIYYFTGNVYVWDNHVAFAHSDNHRIIGYFERGT